MTRRVCLRLLSACCLFALGIVSARAKPFDWSLSKTEICSGLDSMRVTLEWSFNDWEIRPASAMVFSITLKGRNGSLRLRPVVVYGKKASRNASSIVASGQRDEIAVTDVSEPVILTQTDCFPISALDTLSLYLEVSEWTKGGGRAVRSTSKRGTFCRPPLPEEFRFTWDEIVPEPYTDMYRDLDIVFPIRFENGSQRFSMEYAENAENVMNILPLLKALTSSRTFTLRDASLSLYIPPVGKNKESVKLSRQRVQSLYASLLKQGAFLLYKPQCLGRGEDWDGVRQWVDGSRLRGDERLQEILSWKGKDDAKAGAILSEKPVVWDILREHCFPGLGRAVFHVSYRPLSFKTPHFIATVYEQIPQALTARDFYLFSAVHERGSKEWMNILLTGMYYCPDDGALTYDAVMALLDAGETMEASKHLRDITDSARRLYAQSYWCYLTERYEECAATLEMLASISDDFIETYETAVPFINWIRGKVPWRKVNL